MLPALAGLGLAAVGTAGSLIGNANAPRGPSARRVALGTAQARDQYGGRTYAQDAEDALRYNTLNQLLQRIGLEGSSGENIPITYRQQIPGTNRFRTITRNVTTGESPGLLSLLGSTAPEVMRLRREGDEEGSGLMDLLTAGAEELNSPDYANAYEDREAEQSIRGAQSSRGLAYSPSAAWMEAIGLDRNRESRRMARGAYGASVLGERRAYYGDPISESLSLLGVAGGGGAARSPMLNPTVAGLQTNAYRGRTANWNSLMNNIAGSLGGGARFGLSVSKAQSQNDGSGGSGGRTG